MTLRLSLLVDGNAGGAKVALQDTVAAVNQLTQAERRLNTTSRPADRSRDIQAYGAELDKLRAKYNPVFALSKQYETELHEISRAHRVGAISTLEQAAALDMLNARYQATAAASSTAAAATAMTTMQSRQLMFQMVDLGQTIPLAFQSPIFALQNVGFQVAQIGQLYYGQGGMRAALTDMTSMVGGFVRAIGPWPFVIGAAAAAGALFFSLTRSGAEDAGDSLERHEELIGRIRDAYGETGSAAKKYAEESQRVLEFQAEREILRMRDAIAAAVPDALAELGSFEFGGTGTFGLRPFQALLDMLDGGFNELSLQGLADPIAELRRELRDGEPDVLKFREALVRLAEADPGNEALQEAVDSLFAATNGAADMQAAIEAVGGAAAAQMRRVERFADALGALSGIAFTLDDRGQAAVELQKALGANQGPDDAAVALAEYQAALGRIDDEEQRLADKRAERDAKQQARAREREVGRFTGAMDGVRGEIEAMRVEAATFGLAEAAAARYRVEQELIAAAHEANVPVTDDLRNAIAGLAEEYGAASADLARLAEEQERLDQNREVARGFFHDMRQGFQEGASMADTFANALVRVTDRLAEMATNDLLDVLLGKQGSGGTGLFGSLLGGLFGGLTASAKGNVFSGGHLQAFALGGVPGSGIVDRPTLFPMANGAGLMGEAGPEAIMPLKRGANGRLGVEASGGGSPVVIHYAPQIDARGADREGLARVEAQLERDRRDMPRLALQAVREAQSRRVQGFS